MLTLPWDDQGTRILATTGYIAYAEQMRLKRLAFEAAATQFCDQMPSHIHEAKTRLGSMFDGEDYEAPEDTLKRFYLDVEIKPVPEAGDFRAELSDASTKAIIKDIERRTEARLQEAANDVFNRVIDVTSKMVERLRAYKPGAEGETSENKFRDSLVWNVKELAELLPSLNITNDPRFEQLQQRLLEDLTEHSPDVLRDNDRARQQVADKAEKILKKVSGYLS